VLLAIARYLSKAGWMEPPTDWELVASTVTGRRMKLGLTQKQVADRAGFSGQTLGMIEGAKRGAYRPQTLAGLTRALEWPEGVVERIGVDVDATELVFGETRELANGSVIFGDRVPAVPVSDLDQVIWLIERSCESMEEAVTSFRRALALLREEPAAGEA